MSPFVPNRDFEAEIAKDPAHRKGLLEAGEAVKDMTVALAPDVTGAYRDSIVAADDGSQVTVATTDPAGHMVEFGSKNNFPFAPLRRGVTAAGLRLDEQPK